MSGTYSEVLWQDVATVGVTAGSGGGSGDALTRFPNTYDQTAPANRLQVTVSPFSTASMYC